MSVTTQTLAETGNQGEKAKSGRPISTPQISQMVLIRLLAPWQEEPEPNVSSINSLVVQFLEIRVSSEKARFHLTEPFVIDGTLGHEQFIGLGAGSPFQLWSL